MFLLAGCAPARLQGPDGESPALGGTRWRLVAFQSMDDAQGRTTPTAPDRYTIFFGPDGRAALQLDCNRGWAPWKAAPSGAGGSLAVGPLATTRMSCPPPSMGSLLETQLPYVRSYTLADGRLHMALMADGGILTWEPVR
ncbi:MAG: META domain-containing protein [Phenylobacterium sp.]|uniref:META domain-containing protein n=1 Tax=Phenylobacterium sp. TaxID=1871053 RepID=UPI001A54B836|nr:META domain-containing protein [Phenylobacterium sp.]MBL8771178.1 META domain-containing protein [Phenylobacterium sp.]